MKPFDKPKDIANMGTYVIQKPTERTNECFFEDIEYNNHKYPIEYKEHKVVYNGKLSEYLFDFVRCNIKSDIKRADSEFLDYYNGIKPYDRPLHGIKADDGKLIFPYFENDTEVLLFSEEIKLSQKLGLNYQYNFLDGFSLKAAYS